MDELESMTVPAFDVPAEALVRTPQEDAGPAGQSLASMPFQEHTGLTPKHPSAAGQPTHWSGVGHTTLVDLSARQADEHQVIQDMGLYLGKRQDACNVGRQTRITAQLLSYADGVLQA